MPLVHDSSDAAFKTNVKTLMGEVGKSPHVKDQKQALAIAYATKRRGKAFGGPPASWQTRQEAYHLMHSGPILSGVAGRTDHHNMNVAAGSYVLPADHISSLGQGNTLNGMKVVNNMFRSGPYGVSAGSIKHGAGPPKPPKAPGASTFKMPQIATGGKAKGDHIGEPVPIAAAGGEDVLSPEEILGWMAKNGMKPDLKKGHAALDKWVLSQRQKHIKTLKNLPGPAKD
jgi:hypothetical protein